MDVRVPLHIALSENHSVGNANGFANQVTIYDDACDRVTDFSSRDQYDVAIAIPAALHASPSVKRRTKPPDLTLYKERLSNDSVDIQSDSSRSSSETSEDLNSSKDQNLFEGTGVAEDHMEEPAEDHMEEPTEDHMEEPAEDISSPGPGTPLITLPCQIVKVMDAGIGSHVIQRNSLMEEILNIPQVKSAIVKDEGYQLIELVKEKRRCSDRLQTPAKEALEESFMFPTESASDSVSESDLSPKSNLDPLVEVEDSVDARRTYRPHVDALQSTDQVSYALDCIADSTGPISLFKNAPPKGEDSILKEKRKKSQKVRVQDENASRSSPPTRKSSLLSRFKFSSMRVQSSNMEGWDSLTRALARVGATPPFLSRKDVEKIDINPKLSPILKRVSVEQRLENHCNQVGF